MVSNGVEVVSSGEMEGEGIVVPGLIENGLNASVVGVGGHLEVAFSVVGVDWQGGGGCERHADWSLLTPLDSRATLSKVRKIENGHNMLQVTFELLRHKADKMLEAELEIAKDYAGLALLARI